MMMRAWPMISNIASMSVNFASLTSILLVEQFAAVWFERIPDLYHFGIGHDYECDGMHVAFDFKPRDLERQFFRRNVFL